ncbi:phytanoyl-CoA dioxygenase family protein [Pseudomonas sp. WOUb67]|uniref:phytanoyl-CoA dioxygenase family protein n=1 Tax=Pseudomonas sp. WOUb67 TaxID=3161136 RepID=UPI003CE94FCE
MTAREQLHRNGYVLLRQVIAHAWLDNLRSAFESGVKPLEQWPVPRGPGWRHSQLDADPLIQAVCRLPHLLTTVGELIGERFFLSQVDGRDPIAGGGHQPLHRDLFGLRPGDTAGALIYLDDFGHDNGATRIVPGSHRPMPDAQPFDFDDETQSIQLAGRAGDILVFDVGLVHAASRNFSGEPRRTLMASYRAESLYALHLETQLLRDVRMDTGDRFEPSGEALGKMPTA